MKQSRDSCPHCGHLVRSERSGTAVDYCPRCRRELHYRRRQPSKEELEGRRPEQRPKPRDKC